MCCHLPAVGSSTVDFEPAIGAFKPGGEWCPRICDTGCSIYETRPRQCRDFQCAWLRGIVDEKPEHVKIIASLENGPEEIGGSWWVLYEGFPRRVLSSIGDRLCERLLRVNVNDEGVRPVVRMEQGGTFTHIRWPQEDGKLPPWQPVVIKEEE